MTTEVSVHPLGLCESERVGAGTRVWAFAHVMAGAIVGRDCNICDGAFIEGGAVLGDRVTVKNNALIWDKVSIGDDVFIGPNVVFTNDLNPRAAYKKPSDQWLATTVRSGATIGANATVVCGITVGAHAFIGAGSVVTRDVAPYRLVVGHPAAPRGWMCECGGRLDAGYRCPECGRGYVLVSEVEGLVPSPSPAPSPSPGRQR